MKRAKKSDENPPKTVLAGTGSALGRLTMNIDLVEFQDVVGRVEVVDEIFCCCKPARPISSLVDSPQAPASHDPSPSIPRAICLPALHCRRFGSMC